MATLSQIDPLLDVIREPYIPSSGPAFIDTLVEAKGQSVLMVATEMGRVLANAARENETLSYDMRDAWDGIPIGSRVRKTGKISAKDYHLSILGATTPEDLVAKLTETDLRNGWANRWLWFWAERRDGGFSQTRENVVDRCSTRSASPSTHRPTARSAYCASACRQSPFASRWSRPASTRPARSTSSTCSSGSG
jgi:hypothetical protein